MMAGNNKVRITGGGRKYWKTWKREDVSQGRLHGRLGLLRMDSNSEGG